MKYVILIEEVLFHLYYFMKKYKIIKRKNKLFINKKKFLIFFWKSWKLKFIGDWGLGPIPNPHKKIYFFKIFKIIIFLYNFLLFIKLIYLKKIIIFKNS